MYVRPTNSGDQQLHTHNHEAVEVQDVRYKINIFPNLKHFHS